jgi:T5orf172 domain
LNYRRTPEPLRIVYFAVDPERPGYVKIGATNCLERRMRELHLVPRAAFEAPIDPPAARHGMYGRHYFRGDVAYKAEQELHRLYADLRVASLTGNRRHATEWFRAEGPLARFA